MAVYVLAPYAHGWFVLAKDTSAYKSAFDVFTVTLVAGMVELPDTVNRPPLVTVVSSFRLFTLNCSSSVLFVRLLRFPAPS